MVEQKERLKRGFQKKNYVYVKRMHNSFIICVYINYGYDIMLLTHIWIKVPGMFWTEERK